MRHEAWEEFEKEVKKLLAIGNRAVIVLAKDTPMRLDSLAITEVCVCAEESLNVELSFSEVKAMKNYGELRALLEQKLEAK